MRVCLVSSNLHPVPPTSYGAVEVQMMAHATGLAALGHDVHVVTVGEPWHAAENTPRGVTFHRLGAAFEDGEKKGLRALVASQVHFSHRAKRLCLALAPDIVHWHARYPCAIGVSGRGGRGEHANVYHAHNWKAAESMRYPLGSPRRLAAMVGRRLDRRIARRCDHVIGVSEFIRDRVMSSTGVPPAKVSAVTNVVDTSVFHPEAGVGPDPERPVVTFVGRIAAEKGLSTLIRAMATVAREVPEAVLEVVGPDSDGTERGGYLLECKQLVTELGLADRVRFVGAVSNDALPDRLRRSSVLAVPSVWGEPCGVVVLEGLACGVPVLGSRIGGIPELITEGENGMLCTPGDADDWGRGLSAALRDGGLRERSLRRGPAVIEERHTAKPVAKRVEGVYEEVLARRGKVLAPPSAARVAAAEADWPAAAPPEVPAPRRKKVLLLITSTAGGAGEQAYQLARDISHEEFDLTVAFGPGYPLDDDFAKLPLRVEHLSMSRHVAPLANFRAFFQVRRLIREERYDIVCTSCSIAGFVGRAAAALGGVPARVHIIQVYASRRMQASSKRAVFRWIERSLDPLTSRYVAVTGAVKQYGVDTGLMVPEKVDVVFNAAELRPAEPGARKRIREEFDIPDDAQVVGTLGRYEEQKGLEHLLRAAAIVLAERPRTCFVIVGDGPLRGELEAQARELGIEHAVRFTGWRRDIPELLSAMDVFCLASLWETFGIVLAEAMLASLPVVASRVDGIPEVVAHGETGFLVPPKDHLGMAERLLEVLRDQERAAELGRAGYERASTRFSVRNMVDGYERLFRELAQE
jgi:glycosyltransferase involved in cell wall biosynthesis